MYVLARVWYHTTGLNASTYLRDVSLWEKAPPVLGEDLLCQAAAASGLSPFAAILRRLDVAEPGTSIEPLAAFYPASMIKTPLAAVALTLVSDGELTLEQQVPVTEANMTFNDTPSPLVPEYRSPLRELLELMITRSDNVATNMLYDLIGRERATKMAAERLGLQHTSFRRKLSGSLPLIEDPQWDGGELNTHPPADAAYLFEAIARTQIPHAALLRCLLQRQQWNNKLSRGLQAGDVFLHKTGDTDEVTHDGGILELPCGAVYLLVVYTGMESTNENNARFGTFMSALRSSL